MKFGKTLLYILVFLVLSTFFDNTSNRTLQVMVESFNEPLNNSVEWIYEMGVTNFIYEFYDTLFWNRGDELLALTFILIFYLAVDKKVWKS